MQSVIHTPSFLADAQAAGVGEDALALIEAVIAADPLAGKPIPGTGGARTLRFGDSDTGRGSAKGKGKGSGASGDALTIAYVAAEDVPLFLLALDAKSPPTDIAQADRDALRKTLRALADDYRKDLLAALRRSDAKALGPGATKPRGKRKT